VRPAVPPQFNFLKPTHSLFSFFTALADAYSRVMMPERGLKDKLARDAADRCVAWLRACGSWGRATWAHRLVTGVAVGPSFEWPHEGGRNRVAGTSTGWGCTAVAVGEVARRAAAAGLGRGCGAWGGVPAC
jgi:hypothetical protein